MILVVGCNKQVVTCFQFLLLYMSVPAIFVAVVLTCLELCTFLVDGLN